MSETVLVTYGGFTVEDPESGGALRAAGLELRVRPRETDRSPDELAELTADAVAAVADADPFDATVLRRAPRLRVIARTGVGLDSIDLEAATDAGIAVTTTPGVNNETVADHALALILATLRRVVEQDAIVRGGGWRQFGAMGAWQLHGATVGIVGYGAIGRAVGRRLAGFGVEILAHDPVIAEADVPLVALDDLLARSDVVSLHLPLSPDTHGLIDAARIAAMKPGAILVNTARGPIVDEDALADALERGHLRGAGLDVFAIEPPGARRIAGLPNVTLSPHVGGISDVSNLAMSRLAAASVLAVLHGGDTSRVVNPDALRSRAG
ncbi:MAG: D-isomer specific 2-hydroxyacid dehydrogenase [Solirubrobacterales bacterium]|jgi:phosphoglycerate dehydrogenase-like enzyme|nr:D-isomer specific 2-hydroxyacid dehydrogenase [Solirubrobacterales bacterium]